MASKQNTPTHSSLKTMITETVQDIDTHLKAAGYDILSTDKESGARTLDKVRRKVKILEKKSHEMIKQLEKGKEELARQQRQAVKRQYELTLQNERMKKEVKRLKEELDDTFPDSSVTESDTSMSQSQDDRKGEVECQPHEALKEITERNEGQGSCAAKDQPASGDEEKALN